MSTPAEDDYDKLTPEQREVRDKEDRAREAAEQASMFAADAPELDIFTIIDQHYRTLGGRTWEMSILSFQCPRVPEQEI